MPKRHLFGFSLIEMAVVLVVLTIILTVIAQPVANQIESRKIADTQKKLEEVKEALYGYTQTKGRLPRPAISATDGRELLADCATDLNCVGFIPWVTLGVDKADAWGGIIRYSVTPVLSSETPFLLATVGDREVVTRDGAGTASLLATKVAAIVWSHGKRNFGTDAENAVMRPNTSVTNTDESHNNTLPAIGVPAAAAGRGVYSRLPSDNAAITGGEFDDLVSWIPTSILMGKMVQAGKLP
jgi:prepilin-type N-terminal cleavage/methylation domain-containing protein